jgi:hypothetical protein
MASTPTISQDAVPDSESALAGRLDEVSAKPEWAAAYGTLTVKLQHFVVSYLKGGEQTGRFDETWAAQSAYDASSLVNAQNMGREMISNPRVVVCLDIYFGRTPKDVFLRKLEKARKRGDLTIADIRAFELESELLGLGSLSKPVKAKAKKSAGPFIPEGAKVWTDKSGNRIGYQTAAGENVKF